MNLAGPCSGPGTVTKYAVHLTDADRAALRRRIAMGRGPARLLTHARILLKADQAPGGLGWTDQALAALGPPYDQSGVKPAFLTGWSVGRQS